MSSEIIELLRALKKLGRVMAYHPALALKLKDVPQAILLSQIWYLTQRGADNPDGWIYKTAEKFEEETGLSYTQQSRVRKILIAKGILEERYDRESHQMQFRIKPFPEEEALDETSSAHLSFPKEALDETSSGSSGNIKSYKEKNLKELNTNTAEREEETRSEKEINTLSEGFWLSYPRARRINKKETDKQVALALKRIADGEDGEKLSARAAAVYLRSRLELYAKSVVSSDPKYIVHSYRWFKNSRYLDATLDVPSRDVESGASPFADEEEGNYSLTQDIGAEVARQKRERDERAKARRS